MAGAERTVCPTQGANLRECIAHLANAPAKFFLEVFSGKAGITLSVWSRGILVMPPIDILMEGFVSFSTDILDPQVQQCLFSWLRSGQVLGVHLGTPCTTYSIARKWDGGPPPLRDEHNLRGFPWLTASQRKAVDQGTTFMELSVHIARLVVEAGGFFTIENPHSSRIWLTPELQELHAWSGAVEVVMDMCCYGSDHLKPTRFLCSHPCFEALGKRCQGGHEHIPLQGMVWDVEKEDWVYVTKAAQVYPPPLCEAYADIVFKYFVDPSGTASASDPLAATLAVTTPAAERKRPLGQPVPWREHRQHQSALAAQAAGYQMRKGLLPPIVGVEMEPGQCADHVLSLPHPFALPAPLSSEHQWVLQWLQADAAGLAAWRAAKLQWWRQRAITLLADSAKTIQHVNDEYLQRLFCHGNLGQLDKPELGHIVHFSLWQALADSIQSKDAKYVLEMLQGMPIVGKVQPSGVWRPLDTPEAKPLEQLRAEAPSLRARVMRGVMARGVEQQAETLWKDTLDDVQAGYTVGPFLDEQAVTEFVQDSCWIPTPRFPVVQKDKVRGVDGATCSGINGATEISEKLALASTDTNVAIIKALHLITGGSPLEAWVLDESKAYRQIGVHPNQRKFAVITMLHPWSGRPAWFVMVGHSFGWVSAVYNYNRRSRLLNEILVKEFGILADFFYDDKFGFEIQGLGRLAAEIAKEVHSWLGIPYSEKKLQFGSAVDILGVHYNLVDFVIEIKEDRRADLLNEISSVLAEDCLTPHQAGKLRGKLMFTTSQFWAKQGRSFMLALSEREHANADKKQLTVPLRLALMQWLEILKSGKPRPCRPLEDTTVEAVIFTDGFFPEQEGPELPGIGGVWCSRGRQPVYFSEWVQEGEMSTWFARATQIVPVEMLAAVRAVQAMADLISNKRVILLIDSEAVEGALVKGYSGRSDICELTGVFWALVRAVGADIYIDRVPTDANLADTPSRGQFHIAANCRWQRRVVESLALTYEGLGCAKALLWTGESVTVGGVP